MPRSLSGRPFELRSLCGHAAAGALWFFLGIFPVSAQAGDTAMQVASPRPFALVSSIKARRDAFVVKQQNDSGTSCGPSALATVLSYGLSRPTTEPELLAAVLAPLDQAGRDRVAAHGATVQELLRIARDLGFKAQAFWMSDEDVARLKRPVLVFLRDGDQEHFSVLRGTKAGEVFVMADPALGNIDLRAWRFGKMFNVRDDGRGIVIVVEPEAGKTWPEHYPLQLPPTDGQAR